MTDEAMTDGDGRHETPTERSDRNWAEILQELRVTQTGTQIISGFLLALAFQSRFTALQSYELVVYGILVSLSLALAIDFVFGIVAGVAAGLIAVAALIILMIVIPHSVRRPSAGPSV